MTTGFQSDKGCASLRIVALIRGILQGHDFCMVATRCLRKALTDDLIIFNNETTYTRIRIRNPIGKLSQIQGLAHVGLFFGSVLIHLKFDRPSDQVRQPD